MAGLLSRQVAERRHFSSAGEVRQTVPLALVTVIVVAVILRVVSAFYQGDTIVALPGIHDQISYDTLAHRLLDGKGFTFPSLWWPMTAPGQPTAHWSFLYTFYLSTVYLLFGPHPIMARVIQAAIAGILHPWLTWRIGSRLFGPQVGLVAATVSALYAYFVYYAGALMTETFYVLGLLWTLDLATAIVHSQAVKIQAVGSRSAIIPRILKPWLLLGLALGLAVLLRQVILLFVPILFAWILWAIRRWDRAGSGGSRDGSLRPAITGLLGTTLIIVALIAPWTLRNYQTFKSFVLLNTNAGFAFFWANHPVHGTDFTPILPSGVYLDLVPIELRGLDEAALDQALLGEGLRFVLDNPMRFAQLSLSRIQDYFDPMPSDESSLLSNLARSLSFGILLPFTLFGLFLSTLFRRRYILPGQSSAVALLLVFIGIYTLIHLLSWALIRYRLPVDAFLIPFAALAILNLGRWLSNGGRLVKNTLRR